MSYLPSSVHPIRGTPSYPRDTPNATGSITQTRRYIETQTDASRHTDSCGCTHMPPLHHPERQGSCKVLQRDARDGDRVNLLGRFCDLARLANHAASLVAPSVRAKSPPLVRGPPCHDDDNAPTTWGECRPGSGIFLFGWRAAVVSMCIHTCACKPKRNTARQSQNRDTGIKKMARITAFRLPCIACVAPVHGT